MNRIRILVCRVDDVCPDCMTELACTGYKAHPSDRSASDCSTQPVGSHGASHPIRVVQRCARHAALGRGPKRCPVAVARRPGAVGHY
jgi:hypothetical protein